MELDRYVKRNKTLSDSINDAIRKDLENIATTLSCEYDVCTRGTSVVVDRTALLDRLTAMFKTTTTEKVQYCCAVTKSGTRCTKKSQTDERYCKTHIYKSFMERNKTEAKPQTPIMIVERTEKGIVEDFTKKFIDGSFYYVDSMYIYDTETLEKIGYIEDNNYVFTDDPFELSSF